MAGKLIIGISGLRGVIGDVLTPEVCINYGCAFGEFVKEKTATDKVTVCIGRDTRGSGEMISCAVSAALCSVGIDVIDLGVVTTPGVGIMVRELGCNAGVIITASHNPIEYNGIKVLLDNGMAPASDDFKRFKEIYDNKSFSFAESTNCGHVEFYEDTDSIHIQKVLNIINKDVIISRNFNVALDSVNGAGSRVTKKLLKELGCNVTAINDEMNGQFSHTPEPRPEYLEELEEIVSKGKTDIGFAQDPDADRLVIVNEKGKCISEEYTLALAVKHVLSKSQGSVAANLSTSRMIDDVAAEYNAKIIRTPVGEANVAKAMIENNCVIGGEGNGGVIDLRVGPVRDSLVGIALLLEFIAESGKTVSELADSIGKYCMIKDKVQAEPEQAEEIVKSAKRLFTEANVNEADGCRFDLPDGWIHLRMSNTEPVMRVMVEAKNESNANGYMNKIYDIRQKVLG